MNTTLLPILVSLIAITLPACATAENETEGVPAILSDPADNALRERIRLYVRDVYGPNYIADLDALTVSGRVILRDRGQSGLGADRLPLPDQSLQLMIISPDATCQLRDMSGSKQGLVIESGLCRPQ